MKTFRVTVVSGASYEVFVNADSAVAAKGLAEEVVGKELLGESIPDDVTLYDSDVLTVSIEAVEATEAP